ncbi:hypothetical protein [Parvularcula oceani]|uniref:hypothetical protein n=1 Tax=Parvularcula oceani TaxID=1247963 RepID=UPI0004E14617|nr:hypothetical protein [Parvularcula oceani]
MLHSLEVAQLKRRIDRVRAGGAENGLHADLLDLYKDIEERLETDQGEDEASEARRTGLLDMQEFILMVARETPARTLEQIVYKLALWRWHAPDLDGDELQPSDAVARSSFDDLVGLTGAAGAGSRSRESG